MKPPHHLQALILVAGVSGAGKSSALDILSDLGFFVIDNLPVALLPSFLEHTAKSPARFTRTALLMDIDSSDDAQKLLEFWDALGGSSCRREILFLDAETSRIVKRYNETRRPHPAFDPAQDTSLSSTIERERSQLAAIKERANVVIDSTNLNVHDLKRELKALVDSLTAATHKTMRVNFISFGFKHGIPVDCDLLIDVRFITNPYFVDELRDKTGKEPAVRDYVMQHPAAQEFVAKYSDLLQFLLPRYAFEGKAYLNIGVGCTGGRHRSVVIAEELLQRVDQTACIAGVKHRDLDRYASLQRE